VPKFVVVAKATDTEIVPGSNGGDRQRKRGIDVVELEKTRTADIDLTSRNISGVWIAKVEGDYAVWRTQNLYRHLYVSRNALT
jgi:hypothetical protein